MFENDFFVNSDFAVIFKISAFDFKIFVLFFVIANISKLIYVKMTCVALSVSKQYYFVSFSFKVNVNNIKKLLIIIEKCNIIQEIF